MTRSTLLNIHHLFLIPNPSSFILTCRVGLLTERGLQGDRSTLSYSRRFRPKFLNNSALWPAYGARHASRFVVCAGCEPGEVSRLQKGCNFKQAGIQAMTSRNPSPLATRLVSLSLAASALFAGVAGSAGAQSNRAARRSVDATRVSHASEFPLLSRYASELTRRMRFDGADTRAAEVQKAVE